MALHEWNRDQIHLLPPSTSDWVPEDDLVHFIIEAVERVNLSAFKINKRGGKKQYHPRMMLALLIYCYANGIFSSRKIERLTYRDVCVRFLCAGHHPDHDTICSFRVNNFEAISQCFLEVLLIAKELKILKVGTVSTDGTKIKASASLTRSLRYDRALELSEQLEIEINGLMLQADEADNKSLDDGQTLPDEIAKRQSLKDKIDKAKAELESRRAKEYEAEKALYERKKQAREDRKKKGGKGSGGGKPPVPPSPEVPAQRQINLTDADSDIMRKSNRHEAQQAYNAQAAVDADGSQLILSARIANNGQDAPECIDNIEAIPDQLGEVKCVLGDTNYGSEEAVKHFEERDIEPYMAVRGMKQRRMHDFRPTDKQPKPTPKQSKPWVEKMRHKLETEEGRAVYRKRQQTVEPVFGIVKQAMGFRQFLLRGKDKVSLEWLAVALAHNCKRIHNISLAQ